MQGIEVVFHAAAWMGGHDQPGRQYAVTVEGTRNMLQAARKAGVRRVVHTSSVAALGVPDAARQPNEAQLMNENHTWNYRPDYYPYGYAKYLAELEVQKAVAQGLDVVIVNPTLVFGAGRYLPAVQLDDHAGGRTAHYRGGRRRHQLRPHRRCGRRASGGAGLWKDRRALYPGRRKPDPPAAARK